MNYSKVYVSDNAERKTREKEYHLNTALKTGWGKRDSTWVKALILHMADLRLTHSMAHGIWSPSTSRSDP